MGTAEPQVLNTLSDHLCVVDSGDVVQAHCLLSLGEVKQPPYPLHLLSGDVLLWGVWEDFRDFLEQGYKGSAQVINQLLQNFKVNRAKLQSEGC